MPWGAAEEWTEYHLTPNGWVIGSSYDDERPCNERLTDRETPSDRVKTVRNDFTIKSPVRVAMEKRIDDMDASPSVSNVWIKIWVSSDKELVKQLEKQFGKLPT